MTLIGEDFYYKPEPPAYATPIPFHVAGSGQHLCGKIETVGRHRKREILARRFDGAGEGSRLICRGSRKIDRVRFIGVDVSGPGLFEPVQIDVGVERDMALMTGGHDPAASHPAQRLMARVEKMEDHANIPGLGGVVFDRGGPIEQAPVQLRPFDRRRMPRLIHQIGVEFFRRPDDVRGLDGGRRHRVRDPDRPGCAGRQGDLKEKYRGYDLCHLHDGPE